eukprot:2580382-Pyramimonas_sp.AAC.1
MPESSRRVQGMAARLVGQGPLPVRGSAPPAAFVFAGGAVRVRGGVLSASCALQCETYFIAFCSW